MEILYTILQETVNQISPESPELYRILLQKHFGLIFLDTLNIRYKEQIKAIPAVTKIMQENIKYCRCLFGLGLVGPIVNLYRTWNWKSTLCPKKRPPYYFSNNSVKN